MAWLFVAIAFVAMGALMFALAGTGACLLKSFPLARRLSRVGTLTALASLAVVLAVGALRLVLPWSGDGGHSDVRARMVAETIAELLNCVVFALPAALIGAIAWAIARRKLRATSPRSEAK